jgi:hypothetical protein
MHSVRGGELLVGIGAGVGMLAVRVRVLRHCARRHVDGRMQSVWGGELLLFFGVANLVPYAVCVWIVLNSPSCNIVSRLCIMCGGQLLVCVRAAISVLSLCCRDVFDFSCSHIFGYLCFVCSGELLFCFGVSSQLHCSVCARALFIRAEGILVICLLLMCSRQLLLSVGAVVRVHPALSTWVLWHCACGDIVGKLFAMCSR